MKVLFKLLRLLTNYVPQSVKYALARKIGNVSFKVREIGNVHFLDKQLLWLFIKLYELEKAEKIISDHGNELYYLRFLDKIERSKAFGNDFIQNRLDYEEDDFKRILKVNQDLIQQFPNDFLLHDCMAKNYLSGGYQEKAKHQ